MDPHRQADVVLRSTTGAKEDMSNNNKKTSSKPKLDALTALDSPHGAINPNESRDVQKWPELNGVSKDAVQRFSIWMKQTFGTEDRELQSQLLRQATSVVSDFEGRELKTMDHVAAALHGIGPRDGLEGMVAVQMVALHTLAMECMGRAATREQTDLGVEVNINRATKLMRTFANQTEALGRYRGKGEQKMIVEHVHVYKGGQAIVGQVSQKNTRSMRTTPVNDDEQE